MRNRALIGGVAIVACVGALVWQSQRAKTWPFQQAASKQGEPAVEAAAEPDKIGPDGFPCGFRVNDYQYTCGWLTSSLLEVVKAIRFDRNDMKAKSIVEYQNKVFADAEGQPISWKVPIKTILANGMVEMDEYDRIGGGAMLAGRLAGTRTPSFSISDYHQTVTVTCPGVTIQREGTPYGTTLDMQDHKNWLMKQSAGQFVLVKGEFLKAVIRQEALYTTVVFYIENAKVTPP